MFSFRPAFLLNGTPIRGEAKKNGGTMYISTPYSVCCHGELLWMVFLCASAGGNRERERRREAGVDPLYFLLLGCIEW